MVSQNLPVVFIAVMGVTGAGKSSFIKLASEIDDITVGHDLRSCTSQVAAYWVKLDQYEVVLVDTPGFNDTTRSETEVLKEIADWLEKTYRDPPHIKLSGIVYLQSIGDTRILGSTTRNLKMFRKLCGDQPLKNVVLATTFWDKEDRAMALRREEQLRTDPEFWQPMIAKGSELARVTDRASALRIIMSLVDRSPVTLAIQDELINQHKNLVDTSAGITVNEELEKLSKPHAAEIENIRNEMREAIDSKDVELQEELRKNAEVHARALDRVQREQESLRYERRSEQRRHQQELDDTRALFVAERQRSQREREEDKREYETRVRAQQVASEMQFENIVRQLRANEGKVREEQRQYMESQIRYAQAQPASSKRSTNLLVDIAEVVGSVAMTAMGFPMILGTHLVALGTFSMKFLTDCLSVTGPDSRC